MIVSIRNGLDSEKCLGLAMPAVNVIGFIILMKYYKGKHFFCSNVLWWIIPNKTKNTKPIKKVNKVRVYSMLYPFQDRSILSLYSFMALFICFSMCSIIVCCSMFDVLKGCVGLWFQGSNAVTSGGLM